MAINAIKIDMNKNMGQQLMAIVGTIKQQQSRLHELKLNLDNMAAAPDFTLIEAQFGLVAGQGAILYNIIADTDAGLTADAAFNQFCTWPITAI